VTSSPRRSPVPYLLIQLLPVVFLTFAYEQIGDRLRAIPVGGIGLDQLLLISAVTTPLLSQLLSGPLFRARQDVTDPRIAAAAVLRAIPRAVLLGALPAIVVALAIAERLGFGEGASALLAVMGLHLLFAASLVPAYADRSAALLALGWIAYGSALMLLPSVWWLPAVAGAASQIVVLLARGWGRFRRVPAVPTRELALASGRSLVSSFALWSLPFLLFLADPRGADSALVFAALIPAIMAYQIFFATVAGPLWQRLDVARRQLAELPCEGAAGAIQDLGRRANAGEARILGLFALAVVVLVPSMAASEWAGRSTFLLVFAAGTTSVLALIGACRWGMLRSSAPSAALAAGIVLGDTAAAVATGTTGLLVMHALVCGGAAIALGVRNLQVWRRPEHEMFWRTALRR
jgi:hypothetical protein